MTGAPSPLTVFINGRKIGRLGAGTTPLAFQYDASWLAAAEAVPLSLSLPLREQAYAGPAVNAVVEALLPESPIRDRLAAHLGLDASDVLALLSAAGRDCPGAVQFFGPDEAPAPVGQLHARPLSDSEIAATIRRLPDRPLGIDLSRDFRFTLGGAQPKTALLRLGVQWFQPQRGTPTTHILKPQAAGPGAPLERSRSVENEYFCMKVLRALGLPCAEVALATFEDLPVLVVERFDRRLSGGSVIRLPQEDCGQALSVPAARKYESDGAPGLAALLRLLDGADDAGQARDVVLRRLTVNWLLGVTAGHIRNFSLFLKPGGRFSLAPIYDVRSMQPAIDTGEVDPGSIRPAMALDADQFGIGSPTMKRLRDDLADRMPAALDAVIAGLPADFPPFIAGSIALGCKRRRDRLARAMSASAASAQGTASRLTGRTAPGWRGSGGPSPG